MKTKISVSSLILLFFTISTFSQSSPYDSIMRINVEKINKWTDSPQNLAATFERIAKVEQTKWQPYYYASYATIIASFSLKAPDEKDKTLDQAQNLLDAAFENHADSSECMVIQGFLYIAKLQVDPMNRGAEFSGKAHDAFNQAIKLNPENPRGYYMKGISVLRTPDFYGGGKAPAKPILEQAIAKFESFKPSAQFAPDWGKQDCMKQLAACQ